MHYRTLGRTGLEISEVGFGGIPIIRLSMEESVRVLRRAYDRGITFYDTANVYLDSEEKMGQAFAGLRGKLIIATKSMKRDSKGVEADIEQSLRALRTDYLDLYQFHQVSKEEDYQGLMAPGGGLESVLKAREAGKIRHIGFSSHSLEMAAKMIDTDLFSTVQFPFSFLEDSARNELHPKARARNIGILGMKPFGGGVLDDYRVTFAFLRQFPDVIPLPGFDSVEKVDQVCDLYESENVLSPKDLEAMERYRAELGQQFCRRCEYCQPCEQGVMITPAMMYGVLVHRMSAAKAVGFAAKTMATVRNCIECGECVTRCPYNLPIPEILKKHLAMYDDFLALARERAGDQ